MVNKRFNRKFRRALGAALGALSVASISNVDVVNAVLTESAIAADPQLGYFFTLSKNNKRLIFDEIANNLVPNVKFADPRSAVHGPMNIGALHNVTLSFPEFYEGVGNWTCAYSITIDIPPHPTVRVTIIKSRDTLDNGADFLIVPYMTRYDYDQFVNHHDVPFVGNWIKENTPRPGLPGAIPKLR